MHEGGQNASAGETCKEQCSDKYKGGEKEHCPVMHRIEVLYDDLYVSLSGGSVGPCLILVDQKYDKGKGLVKEK